MPLWGGLGDGNGECAFWPLIWETGQNCYNLSAKEGVEQVFAPLWLWNNMADKTPRVSAATLKNEMKMKLLVALPLFQKDVIQIRREFSIPEGGFGKDNTAYRAWHRKKFYEESDEIQNGESYRKEEASLKTDQWEGRLKPKEYEERKWKLLDRVPINALHHRLENLRKKYHLPYNFISVPMGGIRW